MTRVEHAQAVVKLIETGELAQVLKLVAMMCYSRRDMLSAHHLPEKWVFWDEYGILAETSSDLAQRIDHNQD